MWMSWFHPWRAQIKDSSPKSVYEFIATFYFFSDLSNNNTNFTYELSKVLSNIASKPIRIVKIMKDSDNVLNQGLLFCWLQKLSRHGKKKSWVRENAKHYKQQNSLCDVRKVMCRTVDKQNSSGQMLQTDIWIFNFRASHVHLIWAKSFFKISWLKFGWNKWSWVWPGLWWTPLCREVLNFIVHSREFHFKVCHSVDRCSNQYFP